MEYRTLGRSGLQVSTLSLGTMTFGGDHAIRGVTTEQAKRLVDIAADTGVNLIDTADVYSNGESEEIVGHVTAGRRDKFVLATKLRFGDSTSPNASGLTRDRVLRTCEESLRRLRTDRIDLYQMHGWDGQTHIEEILGAFDTLVQQGKVRYVGCSNFSGWHLMKTLAAGQERGLPLLTAQQIYYSLIGRDAERELIPATLDQNLGVLVWSPLAGGLLTGKYRRDQGWPGGARHSQDWDEPPVSDWDHVYDVIDVLVEVAAEGGHTPAQVALAWVLGRPGITSVVIGARSENQLNDTLASDAVTLTAEARERLDDVSARPLPYPYWHQRRTITDRLGPGDAVALGLA